MDEATRTDWNNLRSQDGETRNQTFMRLLESRRIVMGLKINF
jgi:hypothetical protein